MLFFMSSSVRPGFQNTQVSHADIARFALSAFMEPERFRDADITLFSNMKTHWELMEMSGKGYGEDIWVHFLTEEETQEGGGTSNPFIMGQLAMWNMARFADGCAPGKKLGIEMTGFDGVLDWEKNALTETY